MKEISDRETTEDDVPSVPLGSSDLFDRLATLLVGWPLTLLFSEWCLITLALWAPNYLTWPWFTDHDHFAMIAQSWSQGRLPYRDVFTGQFPGEIYLFRVLGEWTGWGNSIAFYAVDLTMVLVFGVLSSLWSLRRFGRVLPGLIGFNVFLTYYLSQDNAIAGQRDWHGTFFAAAGFFTLDLFPGRVGRILSGFAVGTAMSFRPQFLLTVPGMLLAIDIASQGAENRWRKDLLAWFEWGIAAGLILFVAFLPLIANGLMADFFRCIRSISYGAGLTLSLKIRMLRFIGNLWDHPEILGILLALIAVTRRGLKAGWGGTRALVALQLGMVCFGVISPINHAYYQIPVMGFLSLSCAYLSGLFLTGRISTAAMTASSLILLIGLTAGVRPKPAEMRAQGIELSKPSAMTESDTSEATYGPELAMTYLARGEMPLLRPSGRHELTERYPWGDFRASIEYLRHSTTPDTPVANLLLECTTAVTGAIPRMSPLPCDSLGLCWFPQLIPRNLEALESSRGCVVVWDPGIAEGRWTKLAPLFKVVREKYHPEARFGNIEVWRRIGDPPK